MKIVQFIAETSEIRTSGRIVLTVVADNVMAALKGLDLMDERGPSRERAPGVYWTGKFSAAFLQAVADQRNRKQAYHLLNGDPVTEHTIDSVVAEFRMDRVRISAVELDAPTFADAVPATPAMTRTGPGTYNIVSYQSETESTVPWTVLAVNAVSFEDVAEQLQMRLSKDPLTDALYLTGNRAELYRRLGAKLGRTFIDIEGAYSRLPDLEVRFAG